MAFDLNSLPTPDLGLHCLQCDYPLGGLSEHRCPECGKSIDYEAYTPKGDSPPLIVGGKEVLLTPDVVDALRRAKIPFVRIGGTLDAIYGLNLVPQAKTRVGVPRALYFEAIDWLRRQQAGEFLPPDESVGPDWTCAGCGEENPGSFEVCWQCHTARKT